LATTFGSGPTA